MQPTLAAPKILTRPGQPDSVTMTIKDCGALLERGGDTEKVTLPIRAACNLKPETRNTEFRAAVGVSEEGSLEKGTEEKSREFTAKGSELCAKG